MSLPETAGATRPSLSRDWWYALRYWLRGPRGLAALVVSALAVGAALNWSWLAAMGIAPLLLTALPCAIMCGLGLCMSKMRGGSCATSSGSPDHAGTAMPNAARRITAAPEPDKGAQVSLTAEAGTLPDLSTGGAIEPAPDRQPQVLNERE